MTVSTTDIKWFKSQDLTQRPGAGGFMTGNQVVDGEINNLFSDISTLNRTTGVTHLALTYGGLFSADAETLFGSGAVVVAPPADDDVNVLLFAGRVGEKRSEAQQRIEQYLSPGVHTPWRLFQNHLQGVGVLTLWGQEDSQDFKVGETLILTDRSTQEAVRIKTVQSRRAQTFTDANGTFQRDIYTLVLTRPLQNDLTGENASRITVDEPATLVQQTTVSDGARYYGVKAVQQSINAGDTVIRVDSPLAPLVPSTTAETAITDARPTVAKPVLVPVGAPGALVVNVPSTTVTPGQTYSVFVGGPCLPGSVALSGGLTGADDSLGRVPVDQDAVISVDYQTGEIQVTRNTTASASFAITATPAAVLLQSNRSGRIAVTQETRAQTYNFTMQPPPAPGTVTATFRSFGNWFDLIDQGDGTIRGQTPAEGSGNINYATGTASITLGELPDVGTEVIYTWGSGIGVVDGRADVSVDSPVISMELTGDDPEPGSVVIDYQSAGLPVQVTDDGNGALMLGGDVVGSILYAGGVITLRPDDWPDADSAITVTFNAGGNVQEPFQPTVGGGESGPVNLVLQQGPVAPRSVRLKWLVEFTENGLLRVDEVAIVDDGNGGFIYSTDGALNGQAVVGGVINYATGEASFPTTAIVDTVVPVTISGPDTDANGNTVITTTTVGTTIVQGVWRFSTGGTITATYRNDGAVVTEQFQSFETPEIAINLTPATSLPIAPGSIVFRVNGREYRDRNGALVYDVDPLTNAGQAGGFVDYTTGRAVISSWASGSNEVFVIGLGLTEGAAPVDAIHHRTEAAPIKQASYFIRAVELGSGALLQGVADVDGIINGDQVAGSIDVETGITEVRFGRYVLAAGNEGQWWFNAAAVRPDGTIWQPVLVDPSTVFYNSVAFAALPLPPDILGLDAIRMPQNGRVPIFRAGDIALIHRAGGAQVAAPVDGEVVDLGLPSIKFLTVKDANGNDVASDRYSVDDAAGIFRWANPLTLDDYTLPIKIEAITYYQSLVTDAQINGAVSLAQGAPFALPADGTYISSKLIFRPQDLQANVTEVFSQVAWTTVWADEQLGGSTAGQYDDINNPIEITNAGSQTERWRVQFVTSTTVNVIGELFGQVLTGVSIADDIAPINPATNAPYFVIPSAGWSGGWNAGNVVRFNTVAANFPVWFIRTVLPSEAEITQDGFRVLLQGDAEGA